MKGGDMRRRTVLIGGGMLLAGAAAVALGPRPDGRIAAAPPAPPADLDAWLAASEGRYPDLLQGTEKTIVRAPAAAAGRALSLVYFHGFSASRVEVSPLVEELGARLHADAFFTRLPGHGRSDAAMGEASYSDWIATGLEAVAVGERLGRRQVLIGTSTGATLALWLAATGRAPGAAALVLISPNFGPLEPGADLLLWPWVARIAPAILGEWRTWTPSNAEQGRWWKTRYPLRAAVPMMQLVDAVRGLDLSALRVPILVFYSTQDRIVDPARIVARFAGTPATLIEIHGADDPNRHVLAGRILSPGTTARVRDATLAFLASRGMAP
jgi:alpha-beta hydrolase superfamily lysophospholipase